MAAASRHLLFDNVGWMAVASRHLLNRFAKTLPVVVRLLRFPPTCLPRPCPLPSPSPRAKGRGGGGRRGHPTNTPHIDVKFKGRSGPCKGGHKPLRPSTSTVKAPPRARAPVHTSPPRGPKTYVFLYMAGDRRILFGEFKRPPASPKAPNFYLVWSVRESSI